MKSIYTAFILLLTAGFTLGQTIEISCDQPELIFNNHVGNEWSHYFELNGATYSILKPIRIDQANASKVKFTIGELNEKYPDFASQLIGIDPW